MPVRLVAKKFQFYVSSVAHFEATLLTDKSFRAYIVHKVEIQYNIQQTNSYV